MALALLYSLTGDIGIAIILSRSHPAAAGAPLPRADRLAAPDADAAAGAGGDPAKYKGNRDKTSEEQMKLYKERGVNPAAGCLPALSSAAPAPAHVPGLQRRPAGARHQLDAPGLREQGRSTSPASSRATPRRPASTPSCPGSSTWTPHQPRSCSSVASAFGISLLAIVSAAPAAGPDAHDADAQRRLPGAQPAAYLPDPAALLAGLRRVPAGWPLHLLDHDHDLLDRSAIPDRRLGRVLPALRVDARLREEPPAALSSPVLCSACRRSGHRQLGARSHLAGRPQTARQEPSGRSAPGRVPADEGDVDERIPGVHRQDRRRGPAQRARRRSAWVASTTSTSRS